MPPPLLIVFSEQRWGLVFGRPQQLLSRLAGRWRVLFVEAPVHDPGAAWLEEQPLDEQLTVLVPHTPLAAPGFHEEQVGLLQDLLAAHLRRAMQAVDVAWLHTPMALPLLPSLRPRCVVYDCIHDRSTSKGQACQWQQHEAALLQRADLVLTGGPSLYEARRDHNPHVTCLPSAVDAAHYAPDRLHSDILYARRAQRLQGHWPRPRLGYFGAIDERLDGELLTQLADAHPQWSLVMAGPVLLDAGALPARPNIHWLGPQPYAQLPHLLAGWDLCLLPFALNEATRMLCPAKVLEYMAGGKPVVSTPVHDVVWMYSEVVAIAARGHPFVAACETLLTESTATRAQREQQMLFVVSASSWERSAQAVHELLLQALAAAPREALHLARPAAAQRPAAMAGGG